MARACLSQAATEVNTPEVEVLQHVQVSPHLAELVARAVEAALCVGVKDPTGLGLTVVLADDAELARLNRQFRGAEGATDVLSFAFDDQVPGADEEMAGYLGDVVISVERARMQAAALGRSLEGELATLAAHGTLHLLGYDHAEEEERRIMWQLQEQAVAYATE